MSQLDEMERLRLAEAILQMQTFLHRNTAVLDAAVLRMLNNFIGNARNHLAALDEDLIVENRHKKETEERQLAVMHRLAERELALSQEESETYSRFLEKDAFTKGDFAALSGFYSNAWDRLSEGGKAEMTTRVWEGVRRQEYHFSELPEVVKEKEAERLQQLLLKGSGVARDLERIPAPDREDFLSAWKAGKRADAFEILDRPSFAENVSVSSRKVKMQSGREQAGDRSAFVEAVKAVEKSGEAQQPVTNPELNPISDVDLSGVSLDKLGLETFFTKPTDLPVTTPSRPIVPLER